MDIKRFFKLAADIATSKDDLRSFKIGAVGIRSDEVIVCSANGPVQMNDDICKSRYAPAHAEARLSSKLDVNSVVFVARVRALDNKLALARPCSNCLPTLIGRGVKKIYYTIYDDCYGVIKIKNKKIKGEFFVFKNCPYEKIWELLQLLSSNGLDTQSNTVIIK